MQNNPIIIGAGNCYLYGNVYPSYVSKLEESHNTVSCEQEVILKAPEHLKQFQCKFTRKRRSRN